MTQNMSLCMISKHIKISFTIKVSYFMDPRKLKHIQIFWIRNYIEIFHRNLKWARKKFSDPKQRIFCWIKDTTVILLFPIFFYFWGHIKYLCIGDIIVISNSLTNFAVFYKVAMVISKKMFRIMNFKWLFLINNEEILNEI